MPKFESIPSLPVFMALGTLQNVVKKRLFGGQYILAGAYIAILASLYEDCALLGRMFKDDVANLAHLLKVKMGNEEKFIAFLKEQATERLEQYRLIYGEPPDSLFVLVLATVYAKFGFMYPYGKVGTFNDFKRLGDYAQTKVNIRNESIWKRADMTLSEGIGFGLLYPELTWNLVVKQHTIVDLQNEDWKRFFSLTGQAIPEGLATDSPQQVEQTVLFIVKTYVQQFRPELYTTLDILK